ncbi:hypothetical protein [Thiocapsa rosea]|uniref:Uncharacterized protein n=1 Tax=Thiocapsa rosea TaxID=69360 RepID=A0A495VF34_9GAMM|nr:hypothetical protein [Thiocapsa rosea]RKT47055.1 hypothetical protein BDD21_4606 [Thiocapsa rosea]
MATAPTLLSHETPDDLHEEETQSHRKSPNLSLAGKTDSRSGDGLETSDLTSNRLAEITPEATAPVSATSDVSTSGRAGADVAEWVSQIEGAWHKTIQDIIEVGKLLKRAKDELGTTYEQLVRQLPFSSSQAGNFVRISEHRVLSDRACWNSLPKALNTLYYLSRLDDSHVREAIDSGDISPDTTLSQAKALVSGQTKTVGGRQAKSESADYMDVTVSIPRTSDVSAVLQATRAMAGSFGGTIDYRKNETSVGEFLLKDTKEFIERSLVETQADLTNATLDEVRMLERAAETLSKGKTKKGDPEPKLPGEDPDATALTALLGVQEITCTSIKEWCSANGVPTRLALDEVAQPFYPWEQARLVVENPDDKAARKRLEQLSRGGNRAIRRLALDIMDGLDNMADFESQFPNANGPLK